MMMCPDATKRPRKLGQESSHPMRSLTLDYPVYTLDNEVLLSAGAVVTRETLNELISSRQEKDEPRIPILAFGTVREDLLAALKQCPYQVIFDDDGKMKDLLSFMNRVQMVPPVLNSLNYFKEKDFYTYVHVLKVFALSSLLAQILLEDSQEQRLETMAGPIHDFGKICVPLSTLKKSSPLTRTERGILEHHTLAGYVLLSYYLRDANSFLAKVSKEHHEKRDGSGYPLGIRLADPMVEIIVVSDIYDALISHRPYRKTPYDNRTALEEITRMARHGELGWDVVKALISQNRSMKPPPNECLVSLEKRGDPPPDNFYGVTEEEES